MGRAHCQETGREKTQGIQNPNPMSKMQNKDHSSKADLGLGRVSWCIYQNVLSYAEVDHLSGLRVYFWFTCQALWGLIKGYAPQTVLETQAGEGHHLVRLPSQLVASGLTNKGERLC